MLNLFASFVAVVAIPVCMICIITTLFRRATFLGTFRYEVDKGRVAVLGYRPDAGTVMKVSGYFAAPITSLRVICGQTGFEAPPVLSGAIDGPFWYYALNFVFFKIFTLYAIVMSLALMPIVISVWIIQMARHPATS